MAGARRRRSTEDVLGVLAHELRNPLASLQGCALTLRDRREQLTPDVQAGLTDVIVGQTQRLDWLIRATVALGKHGSDGPAPVDVAGLLRDAGMFAGVPVVVKASLWVVADERHFRLALEALLLALGAAGATATASLSESGAIEVNSSARDVTKGAREWKLDLARRLLREQGFVLTVRRVPSGTAVRARLVRAGGSDRVYEEVS